MARPVYPSTDARFRLSRANSRDDRQHSQSSHSLTPGGRGIPPDRSTSHAPGSRGRGTAPAQVLRPGPATNSNQPRSIGHGRGSNQTPSVSRTYGTETVSQHSRPQFASRPRFRLPTSTCWSPGCTEIHPAHQPDPHVIHYTHQSSASCQPNNRPTNPPPVQSLGALPRTSVQSRLAPKKVDVSTHTLLIQVRDDTFERGTQTVLSFFDTFDVGTQTQESVSEIITAPLVDLNISLPAPVAPDTSEDEDNFKPLFSIHHPDDRPYFEVLEDLCLEFPDGACGC